MRLHDEVTHAGFDQLDPPAVDDLVVRRRRHGDGPAEMVRDAQAHLVNCPLLRTIGSTNRPRRSDP
jgi:hypothetical protein